MTTSVSMALGYDTEALSAQASVLASCYAFVLDNDAMPRLQLTPTRLELRMAGFLPLFVDLNSAELMRRCRAGKQQGLVRACKPQPGLRVLDLTAGFGRDAAMLAWMGADVCMVERQPVMAALLLDGVRRWHAPSKGSLSAVYAEGQAYLQSHPHDHDVIYLDPMHPTRQKSALVKKEMQVLQRLWGADDDALALLQTARQHARDRVVVKWPERAPPLLPPDYSIHGKTIRFDVYRRLTHDLSTHSCSN